jgi:hypothetical protein
MSLKLNYKNFKDSTIQSILKKIIDFIYKFGHNILCHFDNDYNL